MLVLSRKKDQRIIIRTPDHEIVLTLVEIRDDKVRLGITAPEDVSVNREEIQKAIDGTDAVDNRSQP